MIAYLPMYDWPEVREHTNDFWGAVRQELLHYDLDVPKSLARDAAGKNLWLSTDLLLSQTCGYPLVTSLKEKVQYVSTPRYDVKGCEGASYSSAIIVKKSSGLELDTIKGTILAISSTTSWSGYKTLVEKFGDLKDLFGNLEPSGGHRQSARLVVQGRADTAAIDAVCWHMLQCYEPETAKNLKVIGWTSMRPALPFITSLETSAETLVALRESLNKVMRASTLYNKALTFAGSDVLNEEDYWAMGEV